MSFLANLFKNKNTNNNNPIKKNTESLTEANFLLEEIEQNEEFLEQELARVKDASQTIQAMKMIEDEDKLQKQHEEIMKYRILATAEKRFKQEFEQIQNQNLKLVETNQNLGIQKEELEHICQKSKEELTQLTAKTAAVENDCKAHKDKIAALNKQLAAKEEHIQKLEKQHAALTALEQEHKQFVDELLAENKALDDNQKLLDEKYKTLFTSILVLGVILLSLITLIIIIFLKDNDLGFDELFSFSYVFIQIFQI